MMLFAYLLSAFALTATNAKCTGQIKFGGWDGGKGSLLTDGKKVVVSFRVEQSPGSWAAFGFGGINDMMKGADTWVVLQTGSSVEIYDASIASQGRAAPVADAQDDVAKKSSYTTVPCTGNPLKQCLEVTIQRAIDTGDADDYVFPNCMKTTNIIAAVGKGTSKTSLRSHAYGNTNARNWIAVKMKTKKHCKKFKTPTDCQDAIARGECSNEKTKPGKMKKGKFKPGKTKCS